MSIHDELLQVSTPENVDFHFPVAGIGSRFIAALVDTTIIAGLQGLVLILGGIVAGYFVNFSDNSPSFETLSAWVIGVFGLVSFIFLWGYYIFFELVWNGQTPGKRLAKLRVIRGDGGPIGLTESVIRNLIRLVDFLPVIYGLGVVVMFVDRKARRLGDLAAGTLVVHEQDSALQPALRRPPAEAGLEATPYVVGLGILPVERLSAEDVLLIESFLNRRREISGNGQLRAQILAHIFTRFELPRPELGQQETIRLLEEIAAAARRVQAPG